MERGREPTYRSKRTQGDQLTARSVRTPGDQFTAECVPRETNLLRLKAYPWVTTELTAQSIPRGTKYRSKRTWWGGGGGEGGNVPLEEYPGGPTYRSKRTQGGPTYRLNNTPRDQDTAQSIPQGNDKFSWGTIWGNVSRAGAAGAGGGGGGRGRRGDSPRKFPTGRRFDRRLPLLCSRMLVSQMVRPVFWMKAVVFSGTLRVWQ